MIILGCLAGSPNSQCDIKINQIVNGSYDNVQQYFNDIDNFVNFARGRSELFANIINDFLMSSNAPSSDKFEVEQRVRFYLSYVLKLMWLIAMSGIRAWYQNLFKHFEFSYQFVFSKNCFVLLLISEQLYSNLMHIICFLINLILLCSGNTVQLTMWIKVVHYYCLLFHKYNQNWKIHLTW